MKIAIISDIHDNLLNLKTFFNWVRNESIEKLICCGDVTNLETINFLSQNFTGEIILVRGNMEVYDEDILLDYLNIKYLGRYGVFNLSGTLIGVCHEPEFIPLVMKKNSTVKMIFYGHTHKPWIETRGKTIFVNPGTLGGVFQKASFAFWNTKTGELKLKLLELIN